MVRTKTGRQNSLRITRFVTGKSATVPHGLLQHTYKDLSPSAPLEDTNDASGKKRAPLQSRCLKINEQQQGKLSGPASVLIPPCFSRF